MSAPDLKLQELGWRLATPDSPPGGNFVPFRRCGETVYISGRIPELLDVENMPQGFVESVAGLAETILEPFGAGKGKFVIGTVGRDINVEQAQAAAILCAIQMLVNVKMACPGGDLSKVKAVLRVEGFVHSGDEFKEQPKVINGASDLICEVFGKEVGQHSRFAVGASSLPLGVAVEIAGIFQIAEN